MPSDDCVVVSMTQSGWLVHWFDKAGVLVSSLKLGRDELPMPDKGQALEASLDKIIPDLSGRNLLLKIDYYKEATDPATKASAGVEFASSWVFRMDLGDGKYVDRWQIRAIEKTAKGDDGQTIRYSARTGAAGSGRQGLLFHLRRRRRQDLYLDFRPDHPLERSDTA